MMDHPLVQIIAAGLVSGGGMLLAVKLWIRKVEEGLQEGKKERDEMREALHKVTTRVAEIGYELHAIQQVHATVNALHRRIDEHEIAEGRQREQVARELGILS